MMPARRMVERALLVLALLASVYGLVLGWLWWRQESLLFFPSKTPPERPLAQASDVHELKLSVPGAQLSALHLKLPAPHGAILFLHGNAGGLESWFVNADFYRRANYDLFMLDYRGYGKSTGRIESEAQLHADAEAAWAYLAPQYRGLRLVVYGRSLGTALAARLAAQHQPDLTVLVSPYRSLAALARDIYPWVPAALLRYPLRTEDDVARIASPLVLVHGLRDALIAPAHSEALLARAPQAQLLRVAGAGHNDLQEFEDYRQGLARALAATAAAPPRPRP